MRKRRICRARRESIAKEAKLQKLRQPEQGENSNKLDSSACGVEMELKNMRKRCDF